LDGEVAARTQIAQVLQAVGILLGERQALVLRLEELDDRDEDATVRERAALREDLARRVAAVERHLGALERLIPPDERRGEQPRS
jgi:hypothetical protein